jgi:hypothetical protein
MHRKGCPEVLCGLISEPYFHADPILDLGFEPTGAPPNGMGLGNFPSLTRS